MKFVPVKGLRICFGVAGLALALAGCGRNGAPLPPPGVSEDQAVPYLNENTTGSLNPSNSAAEQQAQQNGSSSGTTTTTTATTSTTPKPKKPFLLDPLL